MEYLYLFKFIYSIWGNIYNRICQSWTLPIDSWRINDENRGIVKYVISINKKNFSIGILFISIRFIWGKTDIIIYRNIFLTCCQLLFQIIFSNKDILHLSKPANFYKNGTVGASLYKFLSYLYNQSNISGFGLNFYVLKTLFTVLSEKLQLVNKKELYKITIKA